MSFIASIGLVTVISWFRNTSVTYFEDSDIGNERFEYFQQVVRVETLNKLFFPFSSDLAGAALALFTFLYVDFLDTSVRMLDERD